MTNLMMAKGLITKPAILNASDRFPPTKPKISSSAKYLI